MLLFAASRFLRAALTILFVMTFAFVVLRLSGDPALLIMSVDAPPEAIKAFREAWGLERPIWEQYLSYVSHAFAGEFSDTMLMAIVPVGELTKRAYDAAREKR